MKSEKEKIRDPLHPSSITANDTTTCPEPGVLNVYLTPWALLLDLVVPSTPNCPNSLVIHVARRCLSLMVHEVYSCLGLNNGLRTSLFVFVEVSLLSPHDAH